MQYIFYESICNINTPYAYLLIKIPGRPFGSPVPGASSKSRDISAIRYHRLLLTPDVNNPEPNKPLHGPQFEEELQVSPPTCR